MIQRRTKAILLIAFGVLVILAVIWWLFQSWREANPAVTQPPAYPDGEVQTAPLPVEPAPAAPAPVDPGVVESRRLEDKLRRMAQAFASRAGTYSNSDDFAALRDAGLEATPSVRTFLTNEQKRLRETYALRSGIWGQTTYGLTSKITSATPIGAQTEVTVKVQTQVITESGDATPVKSYRQANITLQKSGTSWLVSRIDWVDEE